MTDVLLINPHDTAQGGFSSAPLGLAYLAGTLLANGIDVRIVDGYLDGFEGIKKAIDKQKPEWVGVTCYTPGRHQALEIARYAKDAGCRAVLGGPHPSIMHEQIMEHYPFVDHIVVGEGELALMTLLLRGNSARSVVTVDHVENLDNIPFPAWHLLELNRYPGGMLQMFRDVNLGEPRIPVVFSRGCLGACSFCSTWKVWKGWRRRSPLNMVRELELLQHEFGVHHIVFQDDAMTLDVEATKELCRLIIERGLSFGIFGTTRTDACDAELFSLMSQAGFYGVSMGIESGSQRMLDLMCKRNTVEQNEAAINMAHAAGLSVCALIVQNYPGETVADRQATIDFLNRTKPCDVGTIGCTWVLPGTKLYSQMKKEGKIGDEFWLGEQPVYTA